MGRFHQLASVLLLTASALWAQRQMSVANLSDFVRSAVQLRQQDRQVAATVKSFRLTERLDAGTVEDLQGLGAGPQTVAALKALMKDSAALAAPGPVAAPPPVVTIPPPTSIEQKEILAEITRNALEYSAKLPNFICSQITRRQVDPTGRGAWRVQDTIQEQLSYVDHQETYKVVAVNNLVSNVTHDKLGGVTSSGEFGSMLLDIFKPTTEAQFEWDRWTTLRGRRMHVYSFRVRQTRSEYRIHDGPSDRTIIAGYHGWIYADAETKMVMRIKMECDGLEDFPITKVGVDLNYDSIDIAGTKYVLPLRASLESASGRFSNRNDVEFRLYQRFTSDATIIFDDIPDALSADQLEEKPLAPPAH